MSASFPAGKAVPPVGWFVHGRTLHRDDSVAGYLARGVEVRGRCRQQYCRRTCWIDLQGFAAKGFASAPVPYFKALYQCHRLGGCDLEFVEDGGRQQLRLDMLMQPNTLIQFHCVTCKAWKLASAASLARKLKADGRGGPETTVPELRRLTRRKCKCGAMAWDAQVLWGGDQLPDWVRHHIEMKRRSRGERT